MKKNPASKSGIFNPRVLLAFGLGSIGVTLATFGFIAPASSNTTITTVASRFESAPAAQAYTDAMPSFVRQSIEATLQWMASFKAPTAPRRSVMRSSAANSTTTSQGVSVPTLVVSEAVIPTVSPAVRDLPAVNPFSISSGQREEGELSNRAPQLPRNPLERDPVIQSRTAPTVGMPPVGVSFEGMENSQACNGCIPPDPNGAVGPNHYVQMVNESFAIYDKSGAVVSAPKPIKSLWSLTPKLRMLSTQRRRPDRYLRPTCRSLAFEPVHCGCRTKIRRMHCDFDKP